MVASRIGTEVLHFEDVPLEESAAASFRARGFLVVPELLAADEVHRAAALVRALLDDPLPREEGMLFDYASPGGDPERPVVLQLLLPFDYAPALFETRFFARAAGLARALLPHPIVYRGSHYVAKPPRGDNPTPLHQDEAYWDPSSVHEAVAVWMPLAAVGPEHGCMRFVPRPLADETIFEHRHIGGDPRVHGLEARRRLHAGRRARGAPSARRRDGPPLPLDPRHGPEPLERAARGARPELRGPLARARRAPRLPVAARDRQRPRSGAPRARHRATLIIALEPHDLTLPESTKTVRAVLGGALRRLAQDLARLRLTTSPPVAHTFEQVRRAFAAELAREPGRAFAILRRPNVGATLRVLRESPSSDELAAALACTLAVELAHAGAELPPLTFPSTPARVACLGGRFVLPGGGPAVLRERAWEHAGRTVPFAAADRAPFSVIAEPIVLATVDDNPLAMLEAHPRQAGQRHRSRRAWRLRVGRAAPRRARARRPPSARATRGDRPRHPPDRPRGRRRRGAPLGELPRGDRHDLPHAPPEPDDDDRGGHPRVLAQQAERHARARSAARERVLAALQLAGAARSAAAPWRAARRARLPPRGGALPPHDRRGRSPRALGRLRRALREDRARQPRGRDRPDRGTRAPPPRGARCSERSSGWTRASPAPARVRSGHRLEVDVLAADRGARDQPPLGADDDRHAVLEAGPRARAPAERRGLRARREIEVAGPEAIQRRAVLEDDELREALAAELRAERRLADAREADGPALLVHHADALLAADRHDADLADAREHGVAGRAIEQLAQAGVLRRHHLQRRVGLRHQRLLLPSLLGHARTRGEKHRRERQREPRNRLRHRGFLLRIGELPALVHFRCPRGPCRVPAIEAGPFGAPTLWHGAVRSALIALVLFPMWLAYVVPWVRMRRFGATIPDEVWAKKHARHASRFYWLATTLRGGLIKVGQILSTRVDLMPGEWVSRLSSLQDKVTPAPWSRIERQLLAAYGRPSRSSSRSCRTRRTPRRASARCTARGWRTAPRSRSRSSTPTSR
ncbi:MAG: phytanoyl-CoA dioxygenase family protein [Sandaracinaceae bacterium]|nr:phytanoyl-CoA dioxygenase family protein [Sandaracinaceae bacterium]